MFTFGTTKEAKRIRQASPKTKHNNLRPLRGRFVLALFLSFDFHIKYKTTFAADPSLLFPKVHQNNRSTMCSPTRFPLIKIPAGTSEVLPLPAPITGAASRPLVYAMPSSIEAHRSRRRRNFLLFVRVLIKCIEKSNNYKLTLQTKAIVSECVKRNRMGDPHFSPLQESIELRLRGMVGPTYWNQANDYVHCYNLAKAKKKMNEQRRGPQLTAMVD